MLERTEGLVAWWERLYPMLLDASDSSERWSWMIRDEMQENLSGLYVLLSSMGAGVRMASDETSGPVGHGWRFCAMDGTDGRSQSKYEGTRPGQDGPRTGRTADTLRVVTIAQRGTFLWMAQTTDLRDNVKEPTIGRTSRLY